MAYYTKVKKDFSFRKIKFKGIECYEGDGSNINVTVTGTAQMIRQILKSEYAKYNAEGTWVKTRKFAGGDAIDVYLNRFPENVYDAIKADLSVFDSYDVNHRNAKRADIKTDDGIGISAYTSYLHVTNEPPYNAKEKAETAPDWDKILSKGATGASESPKKTTGTSNFSRGELLRECAGWKIYKKTLPTGAQVYNAVKDKETTPNKGNWDVIKSEVYMQSGFKWGRFGAFDKWGSMTENDEGLIFDRLCEVLSKYYGSTSPALPENSNDKPIDVYINGKFFSAVPTQMDAAIMLGAKYGGQKYNEMLVAGRIVKTSDRRLDVTELEPETEPFKINESYKSLPANPKLEFCKINWAEGFHDYADTFPKEFQSFTALTKYIADNIGEVPTQGYDKHGVEWKWLSEVQAHSDRWDVSEKEANPNKYPNLYASEKMQGLCYEAWKVNSNATSLASDDYYFANIVGKDGFEIGTDGFVTMLTQFLTYYPEDKKRFAYNTSEERLERFKEVYPQITQMFEEPTSLTEKEEILATIDALQYLADDGDAEAKTTIDALKYLI